MDIHNTPEIFYDLHYPPISHHGRRSRGDEGHMSPPIFGQGDNIQVVPSPNNLAQIDQVLVLNFNYAFLIKSMRHFCTYNRSIFSAVFAHRLFVALLLNSWHHFCFSLGLNCTKCGQLNSQENS